VSVPWNGLVNTVGGGGGWLVFLAGFVEGNHVHAYITFLLLVISMMIIMNKNKPTTTRWPPVLLPDIIFYNNCYT